MLSDGSYGVPEGLIVGLPVHDERTARGRSSHGLDIDDFSRARIDASVDELGEEREHGPRARADRRQRHVKHVTGAKTQPVR